ncbi:hypothetical protein AO263_27075 [Pseudomonas sp. NZIPFR-PS5]|nr:hypothetical protein AO263_27075 [Pseudomonas sp. NZIPFR-PS5]
MQSSVNELMKGSAARPDQQTKMPQLILIAGDKAWASDLILRGALCALSGGVRNFVFGHNMSKRCMYANQKETCVTRATKNP